MARALQSRVIANAAADARTTGDANSASHLARTQHFAGLSDMATHGPLATGSLMAGPTTAGNDKELLTIGLEDDLLTMLADDWP